MQLTKLAIEHSAEMHAAYIYKVGLCYWAYQLVFVDESSCIVVHLIVIMHELFEIFIFSWPHVLLVLLLYKQL